MVCFSFVSKDSGDPAFMDMIGTASMCSYVNLRILRLVERLVLLLERSASLFYMMTIVCGDHLAWFSGSRRHGVLPCRSIGEAE
jgi:hypothetical protein